jgi:hypothetical protein
VTDGPFAETKEAVGAFDLLECDSLEEAVDIAAAHPMAQAGTIEVRPLWGSCRCRAAERRSRSVDVIQRFLPACAYPRNLGTNEARTPLALFSVFAGSSGALTSEPWPFRFVGSTHIAG